MYTRIVVPLDGSPLAELALAHAATLAKAVNAPIHLLRIVDYTRMESYGPYGLALEYASFEPTLSEEEETARAYLGEVQAKLEEDGLSVTTDVRRGAVVREIVGGSEPGDLIVMGSHGRGGVTRWLLGSVAEDVVRHSTVPVLLVRAPRDGAEKAGGPG
jgi:nucleotide-binding universal stress UspA family protein